MGFKTIPSACFLSPCFSDFDGIFYNGNVYASVIDYIEQEAVYQEDQLFELVLCKFTQHIHYQKELLNIFSIDSHVRFDSVSDSKLHSDIIKAYNNVSESLKNESNDELNDMLDKHGLGHMTQGEKRTKAISFYRSALPFKGKNQALFLTLVFANKLMHGCTYDRRVEKVLLSLTCDA